MKFLQFLTMKGHIAVGIVETGRLRLWFSINTTCPSTRFKFKTSRLLHTNYYIRDQF